MISERHLEVLKQALARLQAGFADLPAVPESGDEDTLARVLMSVAERLQDNAPYHHPYYLGQMLKPPHPVAHLAYTLAMCLNPNNHALDGGRASSAMEQECIQQLTKMIGWEKSLGHLCGGGTVANFEALWISRELTGGKTVVASAQAHYTHERLSEVLGVPFQKIEVDRFARMDLNRLEDLLQSGEVGTVVATLGTTGVGAVDPLQELVELRERYGFRLHVDAAYGGYFRLARNVRPETRRAFAAMDHADSVVIDPHKHGLQPYGCGCVLFRDPSVARIYKHDSPYTYFTSADLHLGEISLECSRAGAAAVALWATMQAFPLREGGEFAKGLEQGREGALQLHRWVRQQPEFVPVLDPELDIVVWMVKAATSSHASTRAREFFNKAAQHGLHLALIKLPRKLLEPLAGIDVWDAPEVNCLRSTVMKAEHLEWMPRILATLAKVQSATRL